METDTKNKDELEKNVRSYYRLYMYALIGYLLILIGTFSVYLITRIQNVWLYMGMLFLAPLLRALVDFNIPCPNCSISLRSIFVRPDNCRSCGFSLKNMNRLFINRRVNETSDDIDPWLK